MAGVVSSYTTQIQPLALAIDPPIVMVVVQAVAPAVKAPVVEPPINEPASLQPPLEVNLVPLSIKAGALTTDGVETTPAVVTPRWVVEPVSEIEPAPMSGDNSEIHLGIILLE